MRSVVMQQHDQNRILVVILIVMILMLALLGPINAVDSDHGTEPSCHHHACWLLVPKPTLPSVTIVAWFSCVFRFTLLREHVLLVFKPPRLLAF